MGRAHLWPRTGRDHCGHSRLNIQKRPEQLDLHDSGYSHVANGDEAQQRLDAFAALTDEANAVYEQLPDAYKPAFYEMVLYSVRASALINQKVLLAERNRLWAKQNRAMTATLAEQAHAAQDALMEEVRFYNEENAGGQWNHMVSPMPLSQLPQWAHDTQRAWTMPEVGNYTPESPARLGVSIEGMSDVLAQHAEAALPTFYPSQRLDTLLMCSTRERAMRAGPSAPAKTGST